MEKEDITFNEKMPPLIQEQNKRILFLWNIFYLDVQKFRNQIKINSTYTSIILEKLVNHIYSTNHKLIVEFDKLILLHKNYFHKEHHAHKLMQYGIFFILLIVLVYFLFYLSRATNNFNILMNKIDSSIKSIDQIENEAENIIEDIESTKDEDIIIEALDELMISSIKLKKLKIDLENLNKLKNKN